MLFLLCGNEAINGHSQKLRRLISRPIRSQIINNFAPGVNVGNRLEADFF